MVGPLTPKPGESSADFKLRIEQAQKDLAAKRTPAAPQAPAADPAATKPPASVPPPPPQSKPSIATPAAVPPAQPPAEPAKPAAAAAPAPEGARPEDKVDPLDWAKKKGLNTPEAIARSLRALETEFHRRNQVPPAPAASTPPYAPVEQPRPSAPYVPPAAPYQPAPAPYQPAPRLPAAPAPLPRQQAQWIAETYQIPLEDVERLAPMVMDLMAANQRQSDQRFQRLERENARNGEMFRLAQDPSFQSPEVQFEMHRILEEEPRIFEMEPAPYSYAFHKALVNIARKHVAPNVVEIPAAEAPTLSSRPPSTLGGDGGSGGKAAPGDAPISMEGFNTLPLDKKREVLTAIGARRPA